MRRWPLVALCLLLAGGFAALGLWQVERRQWKHALVARVDARLAASPAPLPPRAAWRGDLAYTRVRVAGVFDHDAETLVQALTVRGAGWWVMTPLRTADGTVLLVNRGFVPSERRAPATRAAALPGGTVAVTGLLRDTEPGGGFLRTNAPAADRWYARDVAAIAHVRHLRRAAPFFLDADATPNPGGFPVGGLTVVRFADNHLVYALTWFALSALSLFGAARLLRRRA